MLAVSGGPDSMAMLHLVSAWAGRHARPLSTISVATVDHQLRRESAAEAAFVAQACAALGLSHTLLLWQGAKPSSGLAEEARRARYLLLDQHARTCTSDAKTAILTAHTLDDQAETVLMRLKRGSGIDGLSAIPPCRPVNPDSPVDLVRPFLGIEKSRLLASLQAMGHAWCTDPTNADAGYERVRVRSLMPTLKAAGVTPQGLARSAQRVRSAGEAADYALDHFSATLDLSMNDEIFASCARAAFEAGPALLRERVLANLIARFGGTTPAPDLSEIEALAERLANTASVTATLGGAVVSLGPRRLKVWREAARIAIEPMQLVPGVWKRWDNRFWLRADGPALVEVRALGVAGRRQMGEGLLNPDALPAAALAAQPGFWSGDRLLAVPTLEELLTPGTLFSGDGHGPHGPFFAKPCAAPLSPEG